MKKFTALIALIAACAALVASQASASPSVTGTVTALSASGNVNVEQLNLSLASTSDYAFCSLEVADSGGQSSVTVALDAHATSASPTINALTDDTLTVTVYYEYASGGTCASPGSYSVTFTAPAYTPPAGSPPPPQDPAVPALQQTVAQQQTEINNEQAEINQIQGAIGTSVTGHTTTLAARQYKVLRVSHGVATLRATKKVHGKRPVRKLSSLTVMQLLLVKK